MAIRPVSRTRHDVPDTVGVPRPGSTSHEESGLDIEEYVQPLEQAHVTALHGAGVALGLTLSAAVAGTRITVGPGVAVDAAGRHIVLVPGTRVEVSERPDVTSVLLPMTAEGVELSTLGKTGRCTVSVVWRETFDKALLQASTQNPPQRFVERHTPWIRVVPDGEPAPEPDAAGVVLGSVDLDENGAVRPGGLQPAARGGPEPSAHGLRLRRPRLDAQRDVAAVRDDEAGRLATRADGGVQVESGGAALSVQDGTVAARGPDGTARLSVDTGTGRVGIGTTAPTQPLHVAGIQGIRQGDLYLSGDARWSSISYNAFHNDANTDWVFPDPSRPAVTIEMDDQRSNQPRFQVWTTTPDAPTAWRLRFGIDGSTGAVQVFGPLTTDGPVTCQGTLSAKQQVSAQVNSTGVAMFAANNGAGNALCATADQGTAIFAAGKPAIAASGQSTFRGDVEIVGRLTATTKQFLVDHPLDPENRTLAHTSVESAELVNVYSGNVVLDDDGTATVALPEWMQALNTDFRYQLTGIGAGAPVHVSREVSDNSFGIAGGEPGMTVSWQLTGVRQDPWAQQNPLVVEADKDADEQGSYLHPELYGAGLDASVHAVRFREPLSRNPRLRHRLLNPE